MTATDLIPSNADYVRLDWSKDGGSVTVTPHNEDRFNIKKGKLLEILKIAATSEQFGAQLSLLLKVLADWLSSQTDVKAAFLTIGENGLVFVAVQCTVKYNEEFDDSLAELDYAIAHDADLDLIHLNTLSLPPVEGSALEQFLDRSFTLAYHGGNRS